MTKDVLLSMPILIVDDEPTNTKMLEKILTKAGYTAVIVTNEAQQAIPLFERHRPSAILLDLNMPAMDGFAVLAELRKRYADSIPPVVVLTAQNDPESRLQALQGGARDFISKPFDRTELLLRIENMLTLQLAERERLRFYTHYDLVTGLPNRNHTVQLLQEALPQNQRKGQSTAVLLLDLQQLKRINQSMGYEVGDSVLRIFRQRLHHCLAEAQNVVTGRVDGARFLVALPHVSSASKSLADDIQHILDSTQANIQVDGMEIRPTVHIGVAVYPADAQTPPELLARAESALSRAQQQNDLPYAFCDQATDASMREQLKLEADLHRAVERREFFLVYQPQFNLQTGEVCAVEALLRWQHPSRGTVSPGEFIPLLEQTGLILPVGEWLMHEAFSQARRWQIANFRPIQMAINLSPRQFTGNDLLQQVRTALETTELAPEYIQMEITENLLVEDFPGTYQLLKTLEAMGIQIALDDFGTGYSALTYLHAFPFQTLKIDRSFIADIGRSPKSEALLQGIVALAKSLSLEVVAEGIENPEQSQYLQKLNCEIGQGFGLGRPQAATAITELLRAQAP